MQKAVKKQVVDSIKQALPVSVVGTQVKVYWNAPNADVRFTCPSCSTPVRVTWQLPEDEIPSIRKYCPTQKRLKMQQMSHSTYGIK